jgi:drug/metabolite transporter (DMT)-like permease
MRALVPVIVMGISIFYYGKQFSAARKWAVLPIVGGVALAFYGDMSFTAIGAFYTILCVFLAALKAVVGGELLTGDLKLHEIDLLAKMCPLALLQIGLVSVLTGEVSEIIGRWDEIMSGAAPQVVLLSGILSFALNVSSFIANKVTSALTLCIAANVKQVLLVAFGTVYFGDPVGLLNGLGILIVIAGSFK